MAKIDYGKIDELIHARVRLAIMSILMTVEKADFTFLRDEINTTEGNLGIHLRKLEDAHYITCEKMFIDRKPKSFYSLTNAGKKAYEEYVNQLAKILEK